MASAAPTPDDLLDLLVIGGGVNGTAVARDAAGRGLKVALLERGDLAGATSSQSSKMVHGGLRYLEFYEFALVRKALAEREVILRSAPHISGPQAFLLPLEAHLRPAWMIRAGLFLYDHLARHREVPNSEAVDLQQDAAGPAFVRSLTRAFRYWDGTIDDARLVILYAQDAAARGADIRPREAAILARRTGDGWEVTSSRGRRYRARWLLNCTGPWAQDVAGKLLAIAEPPRLSLVQGAHIITRKVNCTNDAWTLQQPDGRIIFVIPYEGAFSLIGTTETPVAEPGGAFITPAEEAYLLAAVNRSLARPLGPRDIVHRYAGIRPLVLEEGKDARETTRDWRLVLHEGAQAMTVVGGKITTSRRLAEAVLARLFPDSKAWTHDATLPGGDMPRITGTAHQDYAHWLAEAKARHANYDPAILDRMGRVFGTRAEALLDAGLGANLGGVFEAELQHMRDHEWAVTAEDVLWRRTKLGLHLSREAQQNVAAFFGSRPVFAPPG